MKDFINVPEHVDFIAKRVFEENVQMENASIIYAEKAGGGPVTDHFHEHNHLFIIVKGEAKVIIEDEESIIKENESVLVPGNVSHSIWNNQDDTMIMVSLSVK